MAIEWSEPEASGYTHADIMDGALSLGVIRRADRDGWLWWVIDADPNTLAENDDALCESVEAAKAACVEAARKLLRDALAELGVR